MEGIVLYFSFIDIAIRVSVFTSTVHLVVDKLPLVSITVLPHKLAVAMLQIVSPLTFVGFSIGPCVLAAAYFLTVFHVADEMSTILKNYSALTLSFVVKEVAFKQLIGLS